MDDSEITGVSCRPCGPRLFDLIAQYPTFDCGLTSWSLLERDEELFEIDDVRDEEKAMQALWNRWIFFRRRCFIHFPNLPAYATYHKGDGRMEGIASMVIGASYRPIAMRCLALITCHNGLL
ncbi:hypothetical protein B0F90DRAFT_1701990 [Multifurca ochricompacta]|uniref:Uncharacterized protein n=1 Tax=Multifurca ochricompacta TaxID=376703 RepID=A0AAD4M7C0_9AGAM|nr:hypothetical protein B0F90DRAFT_1701990 [Multifurca ochricompacta]